jgi:phospholipase/carboxylesterase
MLHLIGFHGSASDGTALADFAGAVAPAASHWLPRGDLVDGAGYTFFRRLADRRIDPDHLMARARDWLNRNYPDQTPPGPVILVGFSSGAIFVTALLACAPSRFAAAILLRPEPIATVFTFPTLTGLPALILSGQHDTHRKPGDAARLCAQLSGAGADIAPHDLDCGHDWAPGGLDRDIAKDWLALRAV